MSERKNIDKLFQEKFKDFEVNPPENTWPELEKRLKKKKDRKVIPFWWKLSGVAAALIIGFLIGDGLGLFSNGNKSVNGVVGQDAPSGVTDSVNTDLNANPKPQDAIVQSGNDSVQKATVADSENNRSNSSNATDNANSPKTEKSAKKLNDYNKTNESAVVKSNDQSAKKEQLGNQNKARFNDYNQTKAPNAIANTNTSTNEKSNQNASGNNPKTHQINQKHNQKTNTNQETAVAGTSFQKTKNKNQSDLEQPNQLSDPKNTGNKAVENKSNTAIATRANSEQAGSNQNTTDKSSEAATKDNLNKNANNTTNPVAAVEEKNQEKKLDSSAIANVVPNALEELLNEKENKVAKEPKLNRWQITSNVAPIYFGSTSGGSPIDSTFADKPKDYNTQVGYGIGFSYAVNKRFTIRTGINKVSLNYDTNDVELYAGMDEGGFQNLDSPAENEFLNFGRMASSSKSNSGSSAQSSLAAGDEVLTTDKFMGRITQKMGYIEVPVEVSYALINKKFGVNVIAGMSTLFLNENEVMLTSEGYKTDLGEANNLNNTHFSTNVGLGVKYSFLKSFEAKFEPIFKYQLNTFSKDNGDFKPYFFGLYTGLSFRF